MHLIDSTSPLNKSKREAEGKCDAHSPEEECLPAFVCICSSHVRNGVVEPLSRAVGTVDLNVGAPAHKLYNQSNQLKANFLLIYLQFRIHPLHI